MIRTIIFVFVMTYTATIGRMAPQVSAPDGRIIINGRDAREGEFPYQASIQVKVYNSDASTHSCGGAVIDEYHILTAGHCAAGVFLDERLVVAGTTDLSVPTDPHRVNLTLEQIYVHEDYDGFYYLNDIALIRVASAIPLDTSYIQRIPLRTEKVQAPLDCVVSGWGTTRQLPKEYPDILQALDVPFLDYELCQDLYRDYEKGYFIPGMLCAGYLAGVKDACKGDSGGPLVCGGQLTGVVSWGEDCAQPNYPGVYADVAYYRDWLETTLARSYADGGLLQRRSA